LKGELILYIQLHSRCKQEDLVLDILDSRAETP